MHPVHPDQSALSKTAVRLYGNTIHVPAESKKIGEGGWSVTQGGVVYITTPDSEYYKKKLELKVVRGPEDGLFFPTVRHAAQGEEDG
jgi:hypothetical protein